MRKSINKVGDLLKAKKWTTWAKQVTIKGLEENIVAMSSKPNDGSQFKSLITNKYNDIENWKSQLNIPNVHLVQTTEIHKVEKEK